MNLFIHSSLLHRSVYCIQRLSTLLGTTVLFLCCLRTPAKGCSGLVVMFWPTEGCVPHQAAAVGLLSKARNLHLLRSLHESLY